MIFPSGKIILVLLFAGVSFQRSKALECYNCVTNGAAHYCNTTVRCNTRESCHLNVTHSSNGDRLYTMGCLPNDKCGSGGGPVVPVGKRQTKDCHECCSLEMCNIDLCSHLKPSACVDDGRTDCAQLQSLFNICNDITHAKLVCPKFCNLCTVVDGNWAQWTSWSNCDVTCDNGTQIRTRTCTNPAPSHGGDLCVGKSTENKLCIKELCPVHGGWTMWSQWGSCSATCDIGLQRRDRYCTNPYPSRFGDHCYGDARDDRICVQSACAIRKYTIKCERVAIGNVRKYTIKCEWSQWEMWSTCSRTCGGGFHTRSRTCSNPKPSILGQYCVGVPLETLVCNINRCPDGGWTHWGAWSTCTRTCGGGIYSRSRTCSNPKPSILGQSCAGDSMQTQTCHTNRCPVLQSAFSVDHPYNYTARLTFSNTIYQHGTDFNKTTGTFTCSIPGTYHFSVTLVKRRSTTHVDIVYCYLYQSGSRKILIEVDPFDGDPDKGGAAVSQSTVLHLNKGDNVYLSHCTPITTMEPWSSFTGFLLYPDN